VGKYISSEINELAKKLAHEGIEVNGRVLHFEPVMQGKCFRKGKEPCSCGSKNTFIFICFEDKHYYAMWCQKCKKITFSAGKKDGKKADNGRKGKCNGTRKDGKPCNAAAGRNGFCGQHQEQAAEESGI
jgi:hypothetical protein